MLYLSIPASHTLAVLTRRELPSSAAAVVMRGDRSGESLGSHKRDTGKHIYDLFCSNDSTCDLDFSGRVLSRESQTAPSNAF